MCIRKMWDKGKKKKTLPHFDIKVIFSIPQLQAQGAISAKLRRTPIMCCLHSFFFLPFLVDWCCQSYFCLAEAQGQHISTTVYRVRWLRASRVSTPRAPLYCAAQTAHSSPPAGKHSHPSQSLKGSLSSTARAAKGSVMSWIKFLQAI